MVPLVLMWHGAKALIVVALEFKQLLKMRLAKNLQGWSEDKVFLGEVVQE
jgi:hypothetical protein